MGKAPIQAVGENWQNKIKKKKEQNKHQWKTIFYLGSLFLLSKVLSNNSAEAIKINNLNKLFILVSTSEVTSWQQLHTPWTEEL